MAALSGIRVAVRLTPKSSRAAIESVVFDARGEANVKARVTAPPVDGKANEALIALFTRGLRIPKRDIRIVAGESRRMKTLFIAGDEAALRDRLLRAAGS